MSRFFSLQKRFFQLSRVLDSLKYQDHIIASLNNVLRSGDHFKPPHDKSLNFIATRISPEMTDTDLQIKAIQTWNDNGGITGVFDLLRVQFPFCESSGMPSDFSTFLFGRKTLNSDEQTFVEIIPCYLLTLNDMSRNEISRGHYDGDPHHGPTEAEHGIQSFLNALWTLDFFNAPSQQKLQFALGAYWHDTARLLHSKESQGREEGHKQHHTQGKTLLDIFGQKVYFFAELHTLMKILLCDLHPAYSSAILSTESLSSFSIQGAPALRNEYHQLLQSYDNPVFYAVLASYFRFLCDECAKPDKRSCPETLHPITLTQHMQLLCLALLLHIKDCLHQGHTLSDIIINLLNKTGNAAQLIETHEAEKLSDKPDLYRDLYRIASTLETGRVLMRL